MPDEEKARFFELSSVAPASETALFALAWFALVAGTVFALVQGSFFVAFALTVFWMLGGFFVRGSMERKPSSLTVGVDGFTVAGPSNERFVPWAEFLRFEETRQGTVAVTNDAWLPLGRVYSWNGVAARNRDTRVPMTIADLEEAAKHWRQERAKPRILQLLEGHDEAQWPAVLKKAAQSDFRTSGITQTHLVEDLLNPETPPVLREVLVKTLKFRIEEDVVEDALETFASERSEGPPLRDRKRRIVITPKPAPMLAAGIRG